MTIDISDLYSSSKTTSVDEMVNIYMTQEEKPLQELEDKQDALYEKKKALTTLYSKLSALKSTSQSLSMTTSDAFNSKKSVSSDAEKFTTSATSLAEVGTHSLMVERLATSDTRVTKQYTDTDTSFSGFTTDQTFSIEVAHPTDADPDNRVAIDVTITSDVFSQTDDDVLAAISDAINDAIGSAIIAGTITNNEGVQSAIVSEQTGVSRLVLRSKLSGYDYRIDFTDSADSLLSAMELNAAVQSSGASGGYMTEVGTSANTSELNSKFTLDGLTFYRNSNSVNDALNGVTLTFLDTFSTTENVTVQADVEAVKEEVRGFLDSYNDLLDCVRNNTVVNSETGTAGLLSNDSRYMDMRNELRSLVNEPVSGVSNTDYTNLFDIGIEANETGSLSIVDSNLFSDALQANTTNVSDIFLTESTGLLDKLIDYVDQYVGSDGLILDSKSSIDEQASYLDDRIDKMEDYLYEKEKQLRKEFTSLQQAMSILSAQSTTLLQYLQ